MAAAKLNADGSTTIYFSSKRPEGYRRGELDPNKGWFNIVRFYSPLQPFFDKTWRIGEIELVQ